MQKFSIILPVRNGGNYVKACVNSILSQTWPAFNLIVLDNASNDGTLEWLRSLTDERIIIYPSAESLSIESNWARITSVPKNEFMTCIGHDDILLPGYLEEMNTLIGQYPDAALYQAHFNFIDAQGAVLRPCKAVDEIQYPNDFLSDILSMRIDVNGTGFMVRSVDYDRIGGIPPYPNLLFADFNLWLELCRRSYKVTSSKNCFSYRLHQSMTTTSPDDKFHQAFEVFVNYLYALKQADPAFNEVINRHAGSIIAFYCKSFSHRLLRTELTMRNNMTVNAWIKKCDGFADLLIDHNTFKPSGMATVRLARFIDSNAFTRHLFLLFKKIYTKPVLK
jgi:glycosyltransferase involved in cell wall biosynthesis